MQLEPGSHVHQGQHAHNQLAQPDQARHRRGEGRVTAGLALGSRLATARPGKENELAS